MSGAQSPALPLPRKPILSPSLTRPDWTVAQPRDPKMLWLDKNENLDPELARLTHQVVRDAVPDAVNLYPDSAGLYRKLADWVGVEPGNLMLTPGSDGCIRVVFETFIQEGDVVVHTLPTFAMYPVYCQMYGVQEVAVAYERKDDAPHLALDTLLRTIAERRPRLVCLPNPDSPTGTVFSPEEMRRLIAAAAEAGSMILIDEAYHPFYASSVVPLTREFPNLVVARTFAKAWGLAGLRIGYAVAAKEVAAWMHKVRPMYEVNTLSVVVMERMLDHVEAMEASVARLNAGKSHFLGEMEQLGFRVLRGEGNFLHVAFGRHAPAIHQALKEMVLYRPDFRDACLAGYTRFSATTPELFQPVIDTIKSVAAAQGQ
jgi:histidinol-phosphate aminotransferase